MSKLFDGFHNLYSTQKTLRFELKPIGETMENMRRNHILEQDEQLADNYKKAKKMLDRVHKNVIAESLEAGSLSEELLEEFWSACEEGSYEALGKIQAKLRGEVVSILAKHKDFKKLFGKEMICDVAPKFADTENELAIIENFSKATTLFQPYHDIRRNLYSTEEKHSTVAYRLIHENLPRFVGNIKAFELLCASDIDFSEVINELEPIIGKIDMDKLFSIKGFNLVLSQKGIDLYNQLLGGVATEKYKIKGLNECINLWNQQHPDKKKLPKLSFLYKQLLSDRETASFVIDSFGTDAEVMAALKHSYDELMNTVFCRENALSYTELFKNFEDFDMNKIYVKSGSELSELSLKMTGQWNAIHSCFSDKYDSSYSGKARPGTAKYENEKNKRLKEIKSRSITDIQAVVDEFRESSICIPDWIKQQAATLEMEVRYHASILAYALKEDYVPEKPLKQYTLLTNQIKDYLDSIKKMQSFLKLFEGSKYEANRDDIFYGEYEGLCDALRPFDKLYNQVRNYVTQKPYSKDKIKLNFETPKLLSGWDVNQENVALGTILRKNGRYYLGIAEIHNRQLFKELAETAEGDYYEKMEYKLLPGPAKMFPKVFFSASRATQFSPSEEIVRIYENGTFKKGASFSLEDCHTLIDFYKSSIDKHEDWRLFDFKFSETESYRDISQFYREVEKQGYKMTFKNVSAVAVEQMVHDGRLYMFEIYCKDFSEYSRGKLDLNTIYFKMLFDERNLENVVYKLNGEAEIFFRKQSIDVNDTPVHRANEPVENKNPLNNKKASVFQYDIIKNKRYTTDKFMLHMPITINFKAYEQNNLNPAIQEKIRKEDVHIIGINRGERNLLYAVVINSKGEIVDKKQFSLNVISNTYTDANKNESSVKTDYHMLLDDREKERDKARKSWQSIERIKELKQGYLGQAIHSLIKLAMEYNAIIVMEDLNVDFVRGRQKIEKQIYQNFEKMLLQKLNYLVIDKDRSLSHVQRPGGALCAYQLANKYESSSKVGKQSGIVFFVSPWNVSKMDPTTGFVDMLYPRYENMKKAKDFIARFDTIQYNKTKDYFEFSFDYKKFTAKAEGTKTDWTICTYGCRLETFKNPEKNGAVETRAYRPTEELKRLFDDYQVDYSAGTPIGEKILNIKEASFYKDLMYVLKMTLQMRNSSVNGDGEEFFQSCVLNNSGAFYNSQFAADTLPKSIDANGAYNIAKKGLLLVERIKQSSSDEKIPMVISNADWLNFIQAN